MRAHLEINPPRTWYYYISLNSHTLMILLQVDPTSGDELEIVYEVVTKLKTPLSLHGLQFLTLDTIVGCAVRFVNCFLVARQTT